ncbi:MAG: hypothetical protein BWX67_00872 [Thermotogae bacterium ADurb.Bin062]|jgi:hypothetical protein|nr:MAG: hypothetical protein BWX67_00872 [Thermotogota bacterium ADurb.Bin062]
MMVCAAKRKSRQTRYRALFIETVFDVFRNLLTKYEKYDFSITTHICQNMYLLSFDDSDIID